MEVVAHINLSLLLKAFSNFNVLIKIDGCQVMAKADISIGKVS
jgi:hypothetical protein